MGWFWKISGPFRSPDHPPKAQAKLNTTASEKQCAILSSFTFSYYWLPKSNPIEPPQPSTTLVFVAKKSRHANLRHATSGLKKVVQMVASAWDHGWMAEDIFIWDSNREIFRTYRTIKNPSLQQTSPWDVCLYMYLYIYISSYLCIFTIQAHDFLWLENLCISALQKKKEEATYGVS